MKYVALLLASVLAAATPMFANARTDDSIVITTNDHHDYVAPDRETLEFLKKKIIIEVYYKNSPFRELSKISATCFGRRKFFTYDHTYFVDRISPLVDTRHDEHNRVTEAYFQLEMRTERDLREPDRVVNIECAKGKIETSILSEAVVR